jgi:hypothetical protein
MIMILPTDLHPFDPIAVRVLPHLRGSLVLGTEESFPIAHVGSVHPHAVVSRLLLGAGGKTHPCLRRANDARFFAFTCDYAKASVVLLRALAGQ